MYPTIIDTIASFSVHDISSDRQAVLQPLIQYLKGKTANKAPIHLNFICTHNSRRSHLAQIWAQTMAFHFGIQDVYCYSGGTEATAMFPKVAETLSRQGFEVLKLADTTNPIYAIKYAANWPAIICFSKVYDHAFNPSEHFAAVLTCNAADEACPMVSGAEARFPITYEDPKAFDFTDLIDTKYQERSLQIGAEMYYVFSRVLI